MKSVSGESEQIIEHCTYAQGKLQSIEEKTDNKSQALQALKASQKHDPKVSFHGNIQKNIAINLYTDFKQVCLLKNTTQRLIILGNFNVNI